MAMQVGTILYTLWRVRTVCSKEQGNIKINKLEAFEIFPTYGNMDWDHTGIWTVCSRLILYPSCDSILLSLKTVPMYK